MKFYRLVIHTGAYGGPRYEYACDDCKARTLKLYPPDTRVEVLQPSSDERCPQCGEAAS